MPSTPSGNESVEGMKVVPKSGGLLMASCGGAHPGPFCASANPAGLTDPSFQPCQATNLTLRGLKSEMQLLMKACRERDKSFKSFSA